MIRLIRLAMLTALGTLIPVAALAQNPPGFPSLARQLTEDRIVRGSALESLVKANQDFSMLRPEEAKDTLGIPPWLRVLWRKAHPEDIYSAFDPTGGYPLVLRKIHAWMLGHQDLRPGAPEPPAAPGTGATLATTVGTNLRISGSPGSPRSTSDIRINFFDPNRIVSASNNVSASGTQAQFYSTNMGATWGQTSLSLLPGDAFHSGPAVDWLSVGTALSTTIGADAGGTTLTGRSYVSIDFGATWNPDTPSTFSGTHTTVDRQMLWVDHSAIQSDGVTPNPFQGTAYAIYNSGLPAFLNRRLPAGGWQTPIQVSFGESTGKALGADVKTNQDGDVFGFWPTTTNRRIFVVKSTNGGVSFGAPVQVGSTFDAFDIGIPAMNSRRALIYVSGGAFKSLTKDMVYASWTDLSGEVGCTSSADEPGGNVASTCKTRIFFSRSTNGGATWSPATMLNNQASLNDQFNQALAVDETTGAIGVVYYDTVGDPGRLKTDLWYQSSFDDGATFRPPVKVTTAQTDEATGGDQSFQYGDYNGLSSYQGVLFPSWTDRRGGGDEEIWTAKIADAACTAPGAPTIFGASTPAANQIQVNWTNGVPFSSTFKVYRALGTCASPGAFSEIASGLASSPYLDTSVSGNVTYAYKVSGVDSTGSCESSPSACAQATAIGPCSAAPFFSGLQSVTNPHSSTCTLSLSWSAGAPLCAGPLSYNVYRSTSPGFVPAISNRIATGIPTTGYVDSASLVSGTTYYYKIRAVDSSNGVEEANAVERSGAPSGTVSTSTLIDTFEGTGFDLPGWTHSALTGAVDWVWSSAQAQSPSHSWFSAEQGFRSERVLVSPGFIAQASTTLTFFHTFAFEGAASDCFDGGTLEISTDGGSIWNVVPDAAFLSGGFNGTINPSFNNPIAGKRAWCAGAIGPMTPVQVNLASFAGAMVRLRWHAGDDVSIAETGWYVDSVTIANAGTAGSCSTGTGPAPGFFTLPPCRVYDTRTPASVPLTPNETRAFAMSGICGIPATATALSLNIAVVSPTAPGSLTAFAADIPAPATVNNLFGAGQTRANNAIVAVQAGGSAAIKVRNASAGNTHVVLDVNGYFQ